MRYSTLLLLLLAFSMHTFAAEEDPRAADRTELKAMLADFESGLNEKNLDKLLVHMDDKAVMTFMTTKTTVGKDAMVAYYNKMFKGPDAPLKDHMTKASLDDHAIFHGDTIVASGRTNDVFTLKNGSIYNFNTRWVASAVKKDGQWKVVSVDFSVDPFDNIVLDELSKKMWLYVIIAFGIGLVVALAIGRVRRKS